MRIFLQVFRHHEQYSRIQAKWQLRFLFIAMPLRVKGKHK